jgi:ketosteroid isomerase-like protein
MVNLVPTHRETSPMSRPQGQLLFHSGSFLIFVGILLSTFLASCTSAQSSDPISIVQTAYDRMNNGDVDGAMELYSDDAVVIDSSGGRHVGSQAIREFFKEDVIPAQVRIELSDLSADGNVVTFTTKVYQDDQLLGTFQDSVNVIGNGQIIFDGNKDSLAQECKSNPAQAFCTGN